MRASRKSAFPTRCAAALSLRSAGLLAFALAASASHAYVINITAGTKSLFLQVGAGAMSGGNFNAGGTPGNNSTINRVSVTVPAASLGAGTRAMTTDSTVTQSPWDGYTFCSVPAQVYVGGFFRTPGNSSNATLTASAPSTLINGAGDTIAFNTISWVSGGNGDGSPTIPSGTFVGGAPQTLLSVGRNTWFESCLQFNYDNTQLVPAGSFTGRVSYTLTAP
ncbi:MAG: hypothetical protein ACYCZ6_05550 [Polaromonas sp.]